MDDKHIGTSFDTWLSDEGISKLQILGTCGNNPDCYYKQLQREKAKVEKLEQDAEYYHKVAIENKNYNDAKYDEIVLLKQALTDIREIVESPRHKSNIFRLYDCEEDLELILEKIKEVLNEKQV